MVHGLRSKQTPMNKKYILKPGRHQFAAGAPAEHTNDNLTDEEAEWYLERYPHIAALFEQAAEERTSGTKIPIDTNEYFKLENDPFESVQSTKIGETERSDLMSTAEKPTTGE